MNTIPSFTHRRIWTARALRRCLHPSGGGGLGLRPMLMLRVPATIAPVPATVPHYGVDAWQLAGLPAWLDIEHQIDGLKFVHFYPAGKYTLIELSAYGDREPIPLAKVAAWLNAAPVRVLVGHRPRYRIAAKVEDRRYRRLVEGAIRARKEQT